MGKNIKYEHEYSKEPMAALARTIEVPVSTITVDAFFDVKRRSIVATLRESHDRYNARLAQCAPIPNIDFMCGSSPCWRHSLGIGNRSRDTERFTPPVVVVPYRSCHSSCLADH